MRLVLVIAAAAFCWNAPVLAASDFLSVQKRVIELFEEHKSAIVRVKAAYSAVKEGEKPEVIVGTGFFISREGHVLTNASIVYRPDRVWVEHRGVAFAARVIGEDPPSNLALLKLENVPSRFSFLPVADSSGMPTIGSMIVRLSAPLEFDPSPDLGLVSGQESRFGQRFFPCAYIRTNLPAGPGEGGAAFLDLDGRLVGIQVGSLPDIGSTYVLPARAALRIRDDLLFTGEVTYGWIGFEVREEVTVRTGKRVVLSIVMPDTPAAEVGMQPDDVLLQVGDFTVQTVDDLRNAVFYTRVGQYVRVRVLRDGEELSFNVRLAARPESEPLEIPFDPAVTTGLEELPETDTTGFEIERLSDAILNEAIDDSAP